MANAICPWEGGCRGQTSQLHIRSPVGPSQVGLSPYCTFYSLLFLPPPKSNHPLPRTAAVSVFRSSGSQGSQTRRHCLLLFSVAGAGLLRSPLRGLHGGFSLGPPSLVASSSHLPALSQQCATSCTGLPVPIHERANWITDAHLVGCPALLSISCA